MSILPPTLVGDGHCELRESYRSTSLGYLSIPVKAKSRPRINYQAPIGRFIWIQPYQGFNEPLASAELAQDIINMLKAAKSSERCNVEVGQHRVWACMDFGSANFLIFRNGSGQYMDDLILCAQQKMIPWVYIEDFDFNHITGNPQVFVAALNGDTDWGLPNMPFLMSDLKVLPLKVLERNSAEKQMEQSSE